MSNTTVVGSQYKNLVTNNLYRCVAYDGEVLTLVGIGKNKVIFQLPWRLVLTKYQEIKEEG